MKCVFHTALHAIPNDLRSLWILTVMGLNHTESERNVIVLSTAGSGKWATIAAPGLSTTLGYFVRVEKIVSGRV
jgi:hypothetical protein